jgi:hypothetical protein
MDLINVAAAERRIAVDDGGAKVGRCLLLDFLDGLFRR